MSQTNTNATPARPENTNGRTKPRTIIRLLSTKFTPRAVSAPTVRSPPPPPSPQQGSNAREQREAALRAVGLLPPLRANKDLSLQEMEQNQRIPIAPLTEVSERLSESSSTDAAATTDVQPSAADLIKKEWEIKNKEAGTEESSHREKLKTFTFGGSSPSLVLPPSSSDLAIAPGTEAEGSLSHTGPDQVVSPAQNPPPTPPDLSGSTYSSREIPPQSTTILRPIPPQSQAAPMETAPPSPYMVPLSLSTKPSYSSLRSKCSAPSSPPPNRELPPLPQTPTVPEISLTESSFSSLQDAVKSVVDTPHSISIPSGGVSGTSTPRPRAAASESTTVQLSLPPPIEIQSPATPQAGGDDLFVVEDTTPLATPVPAPAPAPAPAAEEEVVENAANDSDDGGSNIGSPESISSTKTPSLDSSSQTTTSDSSSTDASPSVKPQLFAPGKTGGLHVKTTGAERVPAVVIGSPVESYHRFSQELDVVIEDDGETPLGGTEKQVEGEENMEEMGQMPAAVEVVLAEGGDVDEEGGKGTQTPKGPIAPSNPASAPAASLTFPASTVDANPTPKKTLMDRRKTLNPFKRAQTLGAGSVKPQAQPQSGDQAIAEPRRRLTVGSSLSNIRRSVVGSLSSKSKSSASTASSGSTRSSGNGNGNGKDRMFNASHLPASPTIPSSFVGSVGSRSSGGGGGGAGHFGLSPPPTPTRLARPVVIHTGGSILEQTQGIEDAETRRMTELAFM